MPRPAQHVRLARAALAVNPEVQAAAARAAASSKEAKEAALEAKIERQEMDKTEGRIKEHVDKEVAALRAKNEYLEERLNMLEHRGREKLKAIMAVQDENRRLFNIIAEKFNAVFEKFKVLSRSRKPPAGKLLC